MNSPCLMFTSSKNPAKGKDRGEYKPAQLIANTLSTAEAQLVILNACNTASVSEKWQQSLALIFVSTGIPSVVAMSFAVTAQSASLFIISLYENLFLKRKSLSHSVGIARRNLQDTRERRSRFAVGVCLDDRLVPVLYQNHYSAAEVLMTSQSTLGNESSELSHIQAEIAREGQSNSEQVIGRDMNMLALEVDFTNIGAVILTGCAGIGKTALSRLVGDWWVRSGFFRHCIRINFEDLDTREHTTQSLYDLIATEAGLTNSGYDSKSALHRSRALVVIDQLPSIVVETNSPNKFLFDSFCRLIEDFEESSGRETSRLLLIARHKPDFLQSALIKEVSLGPLGMEYVMEMSRQQAVRCGADWKEDHDSIQALRQILLDHESNCLFIETFLPIFGLAGCSIHELRDQLRLGLPAGSAHILRQEIGPMETMSRHRLYATFISMVDCIRRERPFAYAMLTCIAPFHHTIPSRAKDSIISSVYDAYSLKRAISLSLGEDTQGKDDAQTEWPLDLDVNALNIEFQHLMTRLNEIGLVSTLNSETSMCNIHVCLPYLIRHIVGEIGSDFFSLEDAMQSFWKYHASTLENYAPHDSHAQQVLEVLFGENRTNVYNAFRLCLQQSDWACGASRSFILCFLWDTEWAIETESAEFFSLFSYTVSRYEELIQGPDFDPQSDEDKEDLFFQALWFVYIQGKFMERHIATIMDSGVKDRFEKDIQSNILRADALWEIGAKRRCANADSRTLYKVIGWQDIRISPQPVGERVRVLLENFKDEPEAGTNDAVKNLHAGGKCSLVMRYLADSEMQREMGGLPEDAIRLIQPYISSFDASVSGSLSQWLTGSDNSESSVMKMIKAGSKAAPGVMALNLKHMAIALPRDSQRSKTRFMSLMDRARAEGNDGHELSTLRVVFTAASADNDYESALDCHRRMLILEGAEKKQYTTQSHTRALDGSVGDREYNLGRILAETGKGDPELVRKSGEHLHKALHILRECPAWATSLIELLNDMANTAWDKTSDTWGVEDICAHLAWLKEAVQVHYCNPLSIDPNSLGPILNFWMMKNLHVSAEKGMIEAALSRIADLPEENVQTMLEICATQAAVGYNMGTLPPLDHVGQELELILFLDADQLDQQAFKFWHKDSASPGWRVKESVFEAIREDWRKGWFADIPLPEDIGWRTAQRIYPYSYHSPIIEGKKVKLEAQIAYLEQEELD